jgi:hypothetical protein
MSTKKTPFEGYFGMKPNIGHLKLFESCVYYIKLSNVRCSKLDKHYFKGLFLEFMAIDHTTVYLDLDSGVVKRSHHAQFDKAWHLQSTQPPAAQLLYDLGVAPDPTFY